MEPRRIGTAGLSATPLGVGLAAVGRPAYLTPGRDRDLGAQRTPEDLERQAHAVLDAAYAQGVRYLDAARSYGRAEAFLSSWLARRGAAVDDVTVASKWGYAYVGDWRMDAERHEVKDHSAAALRRQLAETREHLGDRLAVYQIHSATLDTGVLEDHEVLERLADLAEEGVVVGFTTSGPDQAAIVRAGLAARERCPFGLVQATWNPLEPSVGPALAEAHDAGMAVVIKEALANGRLAPGGEAAKALREQVPGVAPGQEDAAALGLALAQPWADVVLSGAVHPDQVAANVEAVAWSERLDPGAAPGLAEDPQRYWARRSSLPWR